MCVDRKEMRKEMISKDFSHIRNMEDGEKIADTEIRQLV